MNEARAAAEIYGRALRLASTYSAENVPRILALLEEAATFEHPDARYALANWRHFGIGAARDDVAAATLWAEAAAAGHGEATFQLAVAHERGIGVAQDAGRAFALYERAAQLGIANALYELGRCAYYGIGTPEDREVAASRFSGARMAGHAEAEADARDLEAPRRMPPPSFMGPFHATRGGP